MLMMTMTMVLRRAIMTRHVHVNAHVLVNVSEPLAVNVRVTMYIFRLSTRRHDKHGLT